MMLNIMDFKLLRGHTYLRSLIGPGGFVIDAGAHRCEFADAICRKYNVSVIALEPNANLIPARLDPRITLVNAALAAENGNTAFRIEANPEASAIPPENAPSASNCVMVATRSLSSILRQFNIEEVDLLKLDIEEAEYTVLMKETENVLSRFKQISVEFHPHEARSSFHLKRIESVVNKLQCAGFICIRCSFRGFGDVIFIREGKIGWKKIILPIIIRIRRKVLELLERRLRLSCAVSAFSRGATGLIDCRRNLECELGAKARAEAHLHAQP